MASKRAEVFIWPGLTLNVGSSERALQVLEHEFAPGLHRLDDRRDLGRARELATELVSLADGDRPAAGVGLVDGAEVDAPDAGRVVVEQAEQLELRLELGVELLAPLAPQPAGEVAVAGVEMAAHADRPAVVEAGIAAGLRAAH